MRFPLTLPPLAHRLTILLLLGLAACRTGGQDTPEGEQRAAALASGPQADVAQPSHDFGRVTEGDKLTHVFTLSNGGDAPLVVDKVTTSCGCTAAVIKEKTVPPGGQTEIRVELNTTNRPGRQHKSADVMTNDPKSPRTRLEIQAEVVPQLAFEPQFARLTGRQGKPTDLDVWLTGTLAPTAHPKIDDVTGDDAVTATVIEEPAGDGVKRGIRLTLKNDRISRGRGVVHVSTGVEQKAKLQLRFSCETTGNLTAPQQVYLDPSKKNLRERVFQVKSVEANFELREARVLEGPFTATISKNESGYQVKVTAQPPPDQRDVVRGKLVLVSNDRLEPQREVRLTLGQPRTQVRSPRRR
jgi:hypothetical protein